MRINAFTIHVRINSAYFRRFALFDTFRLKRRWVSPCVFSAIFLFFSALCLLMIDKEQSGLIGSVLLCVGLGLPLAYFLSFLLQIHDQSKRLGLKALRPAYTLNFGAQEVRVINDMRQEPEAAFPYASIHGLWRAKDAYYLYVAPARAFILPDGQCSLSPAQMWTFFSEHLKPQQLHGKQP